MGCADQNAVVGDAVFVVVVVAGAGAGDDTVSGCGKC